MFALIAIVGLTFVPPSFSQLLTDPLCRRAPVGDDRTVADMIPWNITVDYWDARTGQYVTVETIYTKTMASKEGSFRNDGFFGISNHAPNVYETGHNPAVNPNLPPVYFGLTFKNKYMRLDNIRYDTLDTPDIIKANISTYAWGLAPSGMWDVDDEQGNHVGFLVGGGNPFILNSHPDETQEPIPYKGSVALLPAEPSETCPQLFPSLDVDPLGKVVNTVYCHKPSEVCYFSVWKFMDPYNVRDPDCFWWCIPNDIYNPTRCEFKGIMQYPNGTDICMSEMVPGTHFGGGVHGFTTGRTNPNNDQGLDIFLFFTGGPQTQCEEGELGCGVSSTKLLKVERRGNTVVSTSVEYWGSQLWEDTVTIPEDVGLDHGWVQPDGQVLWISHFRSANPGISAMNYNTGELILTLHGFTELGYAIPGSPEYYIYPSGINGFGDGGNYGSFLVLPTSSVYGLPPVIPNPPEPCIGTFNCAVGPVFIIPTQRVDPIAIQQQMKEKINA